MIVNFPPPSCKPPWHETESGCTLVVGEIRAGSLKWGFSPGGVMTMIVPNEASLGIAFHELSLDPNDSAVRIGVAPGRNGSGRAGPASPRAQCRHGRRDTACRFPSDRRPRPDAATARQTTDRSRFHPRPHHRPAGLSGRRQAENRDCSSALSSRVANTNRSLGPRAPEARLFLMGSIGRGGSRPCLDYDISPPVVRSRGDQCGRRPSRHALLVVPGR